MDILEFFIDFALSFPFPAELFGSAIFACIAIFIGFILYHHRRLF